MNGHYIKLQSRPSPLPPHRTQLHPRMILPSPLKPPNHHHRRSRRLLFLSPLFFLPLLLYLLSHRLSSPLPHSPKSFSVIISASHRSSCLHVFQLLNEGGLVPFLADGAAAASARARPGISSLASRPGATARQIAGLLERARRAVPRMEWGRTEVRLLESGALRRITEGDARLVLEECRLALRHSGFVFRDEWARSISGKERGIFGWVAANYLLGTFGDDPQKTMGVVEFQGATTQVTFSSSKKHPSEYSYTLKLPTVTYDLYVRSINHFEQEAAWDFLEKIHEDKAIPSFSPSPGSIIGSTMNACIPKGYSKTYNLQVPLNSRKSSPTHSRGNFSECRFQCLKQLQDEKDVCLEGTCNLLSELLAHSHRNDRIPEKFLYVSELFGLSHIASLADLEASGKHYCEGDWIKLQEEHFHADELDLLKYCYSSSYLIAFLHDHLKIPMDRQSIALTNQTGSAPLDWTLGALILQTMAESSQKPDKFDHYTGDDSLTYIALFIVFFFLLLVAFFVWKWQKPQSKMIYDLGQGHYIVTHPS